jgi:hypothetical protein
VITRRSFRADLTAIGITLPNKTSITFAPATWKSVNATSLPIVLDTGTTRNLISNDLYFAIGGLYPGAKQYMNPYGQPAFRVPCDAPSGSFDYTFGNHTVKISLSNSLYKDPESGTCSIGFQLGPEEAEDGSVPHILGDAFLRGAYTVFDMDNDEIWIGEKAECGSNIVPIGKGKDAVPIIAGCDGDGGAKPTTTRYASSPTVLSMKWAGNGTMHE